jgi:hypothetical protein
MSHHLSHTNISIAATQATKEEHTNENAKVCCDEVQRGKMVPCCANHTADAREHSRETDDRMQRRDHLWEFCCRNATSNDCASRPTNCCNTCELRKYL